MRETTRFPKNFGLLGELVAIVEVWLEAPSKPEQPNIFLVQYSASKSRK